MEEYAKSFCYAATGVAILSHTVLAWKQFYEYSKEHNNVLMSYSEHSPFDTQEAEVENE